MLFNADKCSLLRISKKKVNLKFQYSIHGKTLKEVEPHPYLGLELDQDLSFRQHTNQTVSKAQRNLNLLRRNLSGCSETTKGHAYNALVRPVLEYASCDGVVPVFPWPFRRIERPAERKWRAWDGDDFRQETISAIFELPVVFVGECKSREIREAE